MAYATHEGIADKSLREIAAGVGTSHRMLLYHFGSREGLLAAIVAVVEARQRDLLASLAAGGGTATATEATEEVMLRLWQQVSDPRLRPFVRLFFAVVGLAVQGTSGTQSLLDSLTTSWLDDAGEAAGRLGIRYDPAAMRLGVAASRGLLLDLLAGASHAEVTASYHLFIQMWRRWTETAP